MALSRATSLEGLQVLGFDEKKVTHSYASLDHSNLSQVMAHPKVIKWSSTLETLAEEDAD